MTATALQHPEPRPDPPQVKAIDELSAYLKVAKSTLYKVAQEERVPGQKVGKHWRFHRGTIDNWLAEQPPRPESRGGRR